MNRVAATSTVEVITEPTADAKLAGWDGPGWYFWDETVHLHGPFGTKEEAEDLEMNYMVNGL